MNFLIKQNNIFTLVVVVVSLGAFVDFYLEEFKFDRLLDDIFALRHNTNNS